MVKKQVPRPLFSSYYAMQGIFNTEASLHWRSSPRAIPSSRQMPPPSAAHYVGGFFASNRRAAKWYSVSAYDP